MLIVLGRLGPDCAWRSRTRPTKKEKRIQGVTEIVKMAAAARTDDRRRLAGGRREGLEFVKRFTSASPVTGGKTCGRSSESLTMSCLPMLRSWVRFAGIPNHAYRVANLCAAPAPPDADGHDRSRCAASTTWASGLPARSTPATVHRAGDGPLRARRPEWTRRYHDDPRTPA